MAAGNEPDYTPTPEEIRSRCEGMNWMSGMGWELELIDEIMTHDRPELDVVRRLVYDVGPDKAEDLLMFFIVP